MPWPKPTTSATDVARYLLLLAEADEESERLSPLRLQKLLYYVQGWSLARRGKPMFHEKIRAWAYGPVVPEIYHRYSHYGKAGIDPENDAPKLSAEERKFIDLVWATYRKYSAISLSEMTHKESPWRDARSDLSPTASSNREISLDALSAFFSRYVEA